MLPLTQPVAAAVDGVDQRQHQHDGGEMRGGKQGKLHLGTLAEEVAAEFQHRFFSLSSFLFRI